MRTQILKAILTSAAMVCASSAWASGVTVVQTTEQQPLIIDTDTFVSHDLVAGFLRVDWSPRFGELWQVESKSGLPEAVAHHRFVYQADPDFLGFERLWLTAIDGKTKKEIALELEIRVIPSAFPISGRFFAHSGKSFGLYRQQQQQMELCTASLGDDSSLVCTLQTVKGAVEGWWPVFGDWDGDGVHLPSLFDPSTATLHQVRAAGEGLEIHSPRTFSGLEWTFPTAGDWDGEGVDQPAFVSAQGVAFRRSLSVWAEVEETFGAQLPAHSGPRFPWAMRWPLAERDGLGVVSFDNRRMAWVSMPRDGQESGEMSFTIGTQAWRVPFHADADVITASAGPGHKLLILRLSIWDDFLPAYWFNYSTFLAGDPTPSPTTMPLKFPHEPPNP